MNESVLLDLHRAAGARVHTDPPPAAVLTYGDVPAEYRAALEGAALFDATDRGQIAVTGDDAASFLHRLLANDVRNLASGFSQRNLLLSSKGKVLYDFGLAREDDSFLITLPSPRVKPLMAALDMYLFSEKVRFADTTAACAPIDIVGSRADAVARAALDRAEIPTNRAFVQAQFQGTLLRIASIPVAGSSGLRLDAGPTHAARLWTDLVRAGAQPAGIIVRDILRVEAAAAEWGADIDENVYPQEARLERAFSLDKGCYIGQEVVAKIDTYGGLNKRLVALKIAHDDPVLRGTRLMKLEDGEWRDLGVVTSWAYSFVLDGGLALAYVKRRHQKAGSEFRLGDGPATAVIVPIPVRNGALPVTGDFE